MIVEAVQKRARFAGSDRQATAVCAPWADEAVTTSQVASVIPRLIVASSLLVFAIPIMVPVAV